MRVQEYNRLLGLQTNRRKLLQGAAAIAAVSATGVLGKAGRALAQDDLRAQILQIPGVGKGSPTDADWQKVGELCLGATKANVKEGEFDGVELTFMGLNNQNLHNLLFRGFLKPWEAYTGAKINWIDLAQADYNAAPAAVDRHRHGRFRHHRDGRARSKAMSAARALLRRCPTGSRRRSRWTTMSAISRRRSAPGTARPIASRSTATATPSTTAPMSSPIPNSPRPGRTKATRANGACPTTWQKVQEVTKFLKGKKVGGQDAYGYLDRGQGLGRLRLLLPRKPRHRLCQASRRQGVAVRRRHHEAAGQQPGLRARDPGRDRRAAVRAGRPDQCRSGHDRLPAVPRRHRLDARLVGRRRLERPRPATPRSSATSSASRSCRARTTSTTRRPASGTRCRPARTSRRTWPISAGAST